MSDRGLLGERQGRIKQARAWYAKAIASRHADSALWAMANLGDLEQQGRFGRGRNWRVRVIHSGHGEHATRAICNLGNLVLSLGHIQEAHQPVPGPGRLLPACRG
jgi:hypothetical protein